MQPPQGPADLRQRPFFQKLTDKELESVFALLAFRVVRPRSSLALNRDFKNSIGFVWEGRFRLVGASPAGRSATLFALEPGEPFGFAAAFIGGEYGAAVRLFADTGGSLLYADAHDLTELAVHCPELARAFLSASGKRLMDYATRLYELATLDTRTRLCAELLRLSELGSWRNGAHTLKPAPTHAALATQICAAREAVSRYLKELTRLGLIDAQRGNIVFKDIPQLQEIVRKAAGA